MKVEKPIKLHFGGNISTRYAAEGKAKLSGRNDCWRKFNNG